MWFRPRKKRKSYKALYLRKLRELRFLRRINRGYQRVKSGFYDYRARHSIRGGSAGFGVMRRKRRWY